MLKPPIYFLACITSNIRFAIERNAPWLIAVNEFGSNNGLDRLCEFVEASTQPVLLDSGIFNLTNQHARAHQVPMDEALALPPEKIDGFGELFDLYCKVVDRVGGMVWNYIELDQGGRENKTRTRGRLEQLGFKPMPVYHPLNDGWDYFDVLARKYKYICVGNIVQASRPTRLRLLRTLSERARAYPDLWVHVLGYTPSPWSFAYEFGSCDSSSWCHALRWPGWSDYAMLGRVSRTDERMSYRLGSKQSDPDGWDQANRLATYGIDFMQRNWLAALREREAVG